jgi:hypothetical protein
METQKLNYTTLKKEWSISCKNYITLGLTHDDFFIVVEDSYKPISEPVKSLEFANKIFEFYVNKI